ncbi:MAG: hypothetical protein RSD82_11475 [Comamonas sp.]
MTVITDLPDLRPSLLLDFANAGRVDPRIRCVRASTATCYGRDGKLRTVAANVPRIDYDPATGKCMGLLVEEARTNLYTYSADVTHAVWGKTNLTADGSKVLVGGVDFYKVSEVVTAQPEGKNVRRMFPSAYPAGTALSIKWYFIESTRRFCNVVILSASATASIALDTKTGDFGIRQTGLPGWTWTVVKHLTGVIEVVAKNPSTHAEYPAGAYIDIRPTTLASLAETGSIGDTYTGDTSKYVYVGPIQFELGPCATSYISTGASAVTRAADVLWLDLASSQLPVVDGVGTFVVAAQTFAPAVAGGTKNRTIFSLNSGAANNNVSAIFAAAADNLSSDIRLDGGFQHASSSPALPGVSYTRAIAYKDGSLRSATDGALTGTENTGAVPRGLTKLELGCRVGINQLNGYISRLWCCPQRLSDASLQGVSR